MHRLAIACALLVLSGSAAAQVPFKDSLVQSPKLAPPERGSLAGQYSRVAFGPADLVRGGFSLPSPFQAPAERGGMGVEPFPTYSPDGGISEWGVGWQSSLALVRWRTSGDLDYATDDLTSPWGHLVRGSDGAWYPQGMQKLVRVDPIAGGFVAFLPDGAQWTFDARIDTLAGTYAWYLTGAVSATGRRTRLMYVANASGRLFLSQISYGGNAGAFQHQIDLSYETAALPFTDYRSGIALALDQRVTAVSMKSLQAGAMTERWRYALTYRNEGLGPAFFLAQVQQIFASGQAAPPVAYDYAISSERFASASFRAVPKLDAAVAQFGSDLFQANRAALLDTELDARADFEHAVSQTLLVQADSSFLVQPLPPPPPDALVICRPPPSNANAPRTLAQTRASDDAFRVVDLRLTNFGAQTTLTICNREGQQLYAQALPPGWPLGPNTRLVDLNRDHQPDLLRAFPGGYQVIPNLSTAAGHAFGAPISGTLDRSITGTTTWAVDFNGDGIPDLVERTDSALVVWMGSGNFRFGPKSTIVQFFSSSGTLVTGLSTFEFTFLDANKDGLVDVLAARSGVLTLFVNTGTRFVQTALPGISFVDTTSSRAVLGDFAGSGDTEIAVVKGGHAYSLTLAGAETALLRSADDGRGNVLQFAYGRSPAVPGTRTRQAVLSSLTVQTAGHDPVAYQYAYQAPTLHTDGRFLVGFGNVTRRGAALSNSAAFLNADTWAGLPASSLQHDLNSPLADEFEQRTYEDAAYQGIPWKRLKALVYGWESPDGQQVTSERTDYDTFQADVCVGQARRSGASGTLTTVLTRAQIAGFGSSLHCLPARMDMSGTHSDPSLDFSYTGLVSRNSAGLLTQLQSQSASGPLTLQTVAYNPDFTIASISTPAAGTESYVYDPVTLILNEVHGADGVVVRVVDRDSLTGAVRILEVDRGIESYQQFFRYDGLERLAKQWNDIGSATELNPNEILSYQFASGSRLATIFSSQLVDSASGAIKTSVDYLSGAGEPVASAVSIPQGWAFGPVTERLLNTRDTNVYLRPTLPATIDPRSLDYGGVLSGAARVRQRRAASDDREASSSILFHADVQRQLATTRVVDQGLLVQTTTENGSNARTARTDASLRVLTYDDEANVRYTYTYDALGRVRRVLLPDGCRHTIDYDGHGQPSRIVREGIAIVDIAYDPVSGLPSSKTFSSAAGLARRTVNWTYDSIGRVTREQHTDAVSGASKTYASYYDGATPSNPTATTVPGLLTAMAGDSYSKLLEYRLDGKLSKQTVSLSSWRTIETVIGYVESGAVGTRKVRVLDALGAPIAVHDWRNSFDAFGRLASSSLNGTTLATFAYDSNDLLSSATFANGDTFTLSYDGLTRRTVGSEQFTALTSASTVQRMDPRGFVDREDFQVGAAPFSRQYGYSPQGFLVSATDAQHAYSYGFDAFGLPISIDQAQTSTAIVRSGDSITAGGLVMRLDDLGRTVSRGDLTLTYGPDGQVASAQRGSMTWAFVYDESGQRRLKVAAGIPAAAYLEEGYLDASGLVEPVAVGGRIVGLVRNGAYETVATDLHGTVLAERDGTPRLASPFGQRDVHPDVSAALDYVEKGFDADLGLVRMGVRDYDASINRFTTPDLLFVEDPARCLKSPLECNLYEYARGNPLAFRDPTGRDAIGEIDVLRAPANLVASYDAAVFSHWERGDVGWAAVAFLDAQLARALWMAAVPVQVLAEPVNASIAMVNAYQSGDPQAIQDAHFRMATLVYGGILAREAAALGTSAEGLTAQTLKGPAQGQTVLGHFPAYVQKAEELGATRLNIPSEIWNKMTAAEQWATNQRFLDEMIARGDRVILATPASEARANSFFARELEYLKSKGFTLSADGKEMLSPQ